MTSLSPQDTAKGQLQRLALALVEEHRARDEIPTSIRFLFYEMEQRGHLAKKAPGPGRRPDQNLSEALMHLRRVGLVGWHEIVDETRSVLVPPHATSVRDYLLDLLDDESPIINPWPGEPPLLLTESRSLSGVLERIAYEYVTPVAATSGQAGGFLYTDVVPLLAGNERPVLYLGDHDLSGGHIEENTRAVLMAEAGDRPWTRLAITAEQIEERGLTPIRKLDRRYRGGREYEAWETEALGQAAIVAMVSGALADLCPGLADVRVRERQERAAERARLEGAA